MVTDLVEVGKTYGVVKNGDAEPTVFGVVFRVNDPEETGGQAVFFNCTFANNNVVDDTATPLNEITFNKPQSA